MTQRRLTARSSRTASWLAAVRHRVGATRHVSGVLTTLAMGSTRGGIDLAQLLDPGEDLAEIADQGVGLLDR